MLLESVVWCVAPELFRWIGDGEPIMLLRWIEYRMPSGLIMLSGLIIWFEPIEPCEASFKVGY